MRGHRIETIRMPKQLSVALLFLLLTTVAWARDFNGEFAVVFIDPDTEARHGKIPLDRALIARALEVLAKANARAVVLKFFLDQPRSEDGDRRLSEAIARIPVVLQARIDEVEA
jgi:CHASE2 domain-containing sensor protein